MSRQLGHRSLVGERVDELLIVGCSHHKVLQIRTPQQHGDYVPGLR